MINFNRLFGRIGLGIVLVGAVGCDDWSDKELVVLGSDADGDGYPADEDCDDEDASVNPNAIEICDGIDNDCSGAKDDPKDGVWYDDLDGDGYGAGVAISTTGTSNVALPTTEDSGMELVEIEDPEGLEKSSEEATLTCPEWASELDSDCDDDNDEVNPGADELCNDVDDNCDDVIDDDAVDMPTWYPDEDGDHFGNEDLGVDTCDAPAGYVTNIGEDCDDDNADINPSVTETCDGVDEDCNGEVDDNPDPLGGYYNTSLCYEDVDGDGNCESSFVVCSDSYRGECESTTECEGEE